MVSYQNILHSWKQFEHPLQVFWLNIHNIYVHKIKKYEKERLLFLRQLNNKKIELLLPFYNSQKFLSTVKLYINPNYVQKMIQISKKDMYFQNWFLNLYLHFQFFMDMKNKIKKAYNKQIYSQLRKIKKFYLPTLNSKSIESLKRQNKLLKNILYDSKIYQQCEIDQILQSLTLQLKKLKDKNQQIFNKILKSIQKQEKSNKILYCGKSYDIIQQQSINQVFLQKANEVQTLKKYLKIEIQKFQKRQIADSLYKLIKIQKKQSQYFYTVLFQDSMNYGQVILSQNQLKQIQKYREISIFDGYETGIKSRYNFIYSNLTGFRQIYENYGNPCKYQVQRYQMINQCRKKKEFPKKIIQKFKDFQMCHQCQAIFEKKYLISCQYSSIHRICHSRQTQFINSYIQQVHRILPENFNQTIINRFQNYTFSNGVYKCKRKFCIGCAKDYVQVFKNGLCYFCQNICECVRCVRNKRINKLKKIYHCLGGFSYQLSQQKLFKYQKQNIKNNNVQTKKISNNMYKLKIVRIRKQLDQLRLLGDMIKRRQKKKLKILQVEQQNFKMIVKNIDATVLLFNEKSKQDKINNINRNGENQQILKKKRNISKPILCFK